RSSAAKVVILLFISFLRGWASCCGRASKTDFHKPTTLRVEEPNIPSLARQSANECQALSLHFIGVFFRIYKLNRSQNGFVRASLFKLARGVNSQLGAVSRRQRRDPRHGLPAKHHEG